MGFVVFLFLSVTLFFTGFCAFGALFVAAISFVAWDLPTWSSLMSMALVGSRVALVLAIPLGLAFTMSDAGRKAWKV